MDAKKFLGVLVLQLLFGNAMASASLAISSPALIEKVKALYDLSSYESVKVDLVNNAQGQPDHLLVHLYSKFTHRVDFSKITLGKDLSFTSVLRYFDPTDDQVPIVSATCPDPTTQFIVFAPHSRSVEQSSAIEVAQAAEAQGLKTVRLLEAQATAQNYVNYMKCPNLIGNFYDGDANTGVIETIDGLLTAAEISTVLKGAFRYKVTNIWVACQAYNDPMFSAVTHDAEAQKYAAGINDLLVGLSDRVAVCAMKAAIQHQPMTQAFETCQKQLDISWIDHWGFGGSGTDVLGE